MSNVALLTLVLTTYFGGLCLLIGYGLYTDWRLSRAIQRAIDTGTVGEFLKAWHAQDKP
jgi:hypothetical protein